jgi:hypothetical protein
MLRNKSVSTADVSTNGWPHIAAAVLKPCKDNKNHGGPPPGPLMGADVSSLQDNNRGKSPAMPVWVRSAGYRNSSPTDTP